MEGATQKVLGLYKVPPQHNIQLQQQNYNTTYNYNNKTI